MIKTVRNWSEYNKSLQKRGGLVFNFDESFLSTLYHTGDQARGGQKIYTSAMYEYLLTIKGTSKNPKIVTPTRHCCADRLKRTGCGLFYKMLKFRGFTQQCPPPAKAGVHVDTADFEGFSWIPAGVYPRLRSGTGMTNWEESADF